MTDSEAPAKPKGDAPDNSAKPTNQSLTNWEGKTVGHFKLTKFLGRGAMGVVFRAEDTNLKRQVAMKLLPQSVTQSGKTYRLEQFVREARSAAQLDHPHVVQVYEVGQAQNLYYIAMELIEGGNLEDLVKAAGPMEVHKACQLIAEVAEALAYAHQIGIVHRDIKPANLMLSRAGRSKITDFGLARFDDPEDGFRMPSEAVGTPYYVAPEITLGKPASPQSDQYSLGASLWHLLVGKPPFMDKDPRKMLKMHQTQPVPDIRKIRPDMPPALATALERTLAKKPEHRFKDCDMLAKVLRTHSIPMGASQSMPMMAGPHPGMSQPGATQGAQGVSQAPHGPSPMSSQGGMHTQQQVPASGSQSQSIAASGSNMLMMMGAVFGLLAICVIAAVVAMAVMLSGPPAPNPGGGGATLPPGMPRNDHIVSVSQTDTLKLIARSGTGEYQVLGTVTGVQMSSSGKVVRVSFAEAPQDSFHCVFFPPTNVAMGKKFGGANGEGLVGKEVIVRGRIDTYRDAPQIVIDNPDQVTIR